MDTRQMRYFVVRAASIDELIEDVNAMMKRAWHPTGGIVTAGGGFAQAVVRSLKAAEGSPSASTSSPSTPAGGSTGRSSTK